MLRQPALLGDRLRGLADTAGELALVLLLETGQETAAGLREFLERLDHPALGVNLDPANMVLYDKGDPVSAVRTLAPWIKHIHVKDALRTQQPGTWASRSPGDKATWEARRSASAGRHRLRRRVGNRA